MSGGQSARGNGAGAFVPLDEHDARLLELVVRLPLAPPAIIAAFADGGRSSTYRRFGSMLDRGLVSALVSPWRTSGRPARLFCTTRLGLDMLARSCAIYQLNVMGQSGVDQILPARFMGDLPGRLAAYELLGVLAGTHPGEVRLMNWERPWRRVIEATHGGAGGTGAVVRLPAAARLAWGAAGSFAANYLLVPDTGGLAIPALRTSLRRLSEYQAKVLDWPATLIIATTTARRAAAWTRLLDEIAATRGTPRLSAQVRLWEELRRPARGSRGSVLRSMPSGVRKPVSGGSMSGASVARASAGSASSGVLRSNRQDGAVPVASALDRVVLDLVGRHPFLSVDTLAAVLDRDVRWVRARRAALLSRGLLRVVPADEVSPPELADCEMLELTRTGLEVLAAHLGLPLGAAVRQHGLAGGGPDHPVGARAALLRHLDHTLGTDAFMALLARAAAAHPAGGGLVEWRAAAVCAHGRCRPDGYGVLRLGYRQHGFFLEFDRGTMRDDRLRAKFTGYHRYRDGGHASRSFAGFPLLLIVTTEPGAERRLARALRAADKGQGEPLSALLTTTSLLELTQYGPLGAVWRTATGTARCRVCA